MTACSRYTGKAAAVAVGLVLTLGMAALASAQESENPPVPAGAMDIQLVFGTDIDRVSRQVVGEAESFPADVGKVYCLTRVLGAEVPTQVTHAWYFGGKTMARVDLEVRSASYRTWSSKNILPAWSGRWELKVLDATGKVLASAGFDIR